MWIVFALMASLGFALFLLVNQHYKADATTVMLWRCAVVVIAILPSLPFLSWPDDPLYYVMIACLIGLVAFGDRALFRMASEFGAGVTSRVLPLAVFASFVGWLAIDQGQRAMLLNDPAALIIALAAIALCVASAALMRRDPVSVQALARIAPMLLVFAGVDVCNKTAMTIARAEVGLVPAVLLYCLIGSAGSGLIVALETLVKRPATSPQPYDWHLFFSRRHCRMGLAIGGAAILLIGSRSAAMALAPNAGYVAAVMQCSAVWIILLNRLGGRRDAASPWAGLGIVAAAALLTQARS